jgi:phosphonate transport system substrate-binding protein
MLLCSQHGHLGTGGARRFSALRPCLLGWGLIAAGLLLAGCGGSAADRGEAAVPSRPEVLRIGWVPNDEDVERRSRWEGLRDYLQLTLKMPVELVQAGSYSPAIEAMRASKLDVCGLAPFAYLIASEKGVAEPLVAPGFSDGKANYYRSGFIVPANSPVRTMDDVKSRAGQLTLAWADPASASGHLVPRAYLETLGIDPERDFKQTIFSNSHTASIMTVKAGRVDLAAVTTTSLRNMIDMQRIAASDVRVIWESEPIMASIIAMRKDLPVDFKQELLAAYLGFSKAAPDAWAQVAPIYLTPGVEWVAATDADFDSLRNLARGVKNLKLLN